MASDDPGFVKRRRTVWVFVTMACCVGVPSHSASEPEAAEAPVVESAGDAFQAMQRLYDIAHADPSSLDDATLARVFVHLMEYPREDLGASYLVVELERRDPSKRYELARALAIYYGSLNGDLFYVGEGRSSIEAHLRAARHLRRAVEMRPQSMDRMVRNLADYDHPNPEHELTLRLKSVFGIADDAVGWLETLEEEDGVDYALTSRARHLAEVNRALDGLKLPLERLGLASREISALVEFLQEYVEIWPWD